MAIPHKLWCFVLIILPHFISIIFADDYDTYIIHMDASAMPKAFSTHHNWYLTTLSSISNTNTNTIKSTTTLSSSSSSKLIYTYTNAINGFTALLSPSELRSLADTPGFLSSTRDATVKRDTTHSNQFLGLNDDHGVWPASHYGHDVIIGLVDTGIWPESRSFGDAGLGPIPSRWKGACESGTKFNSSLCNNKLIGARSFNKGLLARYPNITIAMNSARDTDGHGTHTSSTAAGGAVEGADYFGYAPGTARGTAPGARVAMYKALWDEGSVLSDIIAAIDQAIADGVDVISISLGIDGTPLYADPIAIAAFAAMEQGIFVSTSAGNEGPFLATLHNGTPWVLTVAASTIDREFHGAVVLATGASITGQSLYPGNSSATELPLILPKSCTDAKSLKNLKNRDIIIVCVDTNFTLGDQLYNAGDLKIAGAVFITNTTDITFYTQTSFPAIFLNLEKGSEILNYINTTSQPKASLSFKQTSLGTKPAPRLASYSSRGPSPSCPVVLKPDLTAPGDQILAAWPSNSPATQLKSGEIYNDFNIISGTSMSCPHAAGVAALLRGTHPTWSPAAIRSAMITTASFLDNTGRPIADLGLDNLPATPIDMGAGQVDPNRAVDPGLVYEAGTDDYVRLMCAMNFTDKQIRTVTRSSSYSCSNASLDLNYPSFVAFFRVHDGRDSGAREMRRTVTNVGGGRAVYAAKVTVEGGLNVTVSPESLEFEGENEKKSFVLRVEDPRLERNNSIVYGALSWIESSGNRVVRSPIVVTTISPDDLLPQG
ncbi:subtilisin-like protease SBT3 [Salvia hispanica]|uniref:subtilisin-like protease SBT3 n=1 Tax=Salvia hispanica TaxID=49212 RepID=UPI002008F174|nr:subtilisin-like protease SBT3 [Salvia hispanica]XP_047956108.1 subtilisin-like protease SBT3 [Salvia hispanica]